MIGIRKAFLSLMLCELRWTWNIFVEIFWTIDEIEIIFQLMMVLNFENYSDRCS